MGDITVEHNRLHQQANSRLLADPPCEAAARSVWDIAEHCHDCVTERRLQHILDNTLDMILIFTPDTLRFVYANKGVVSGMGYSREALLQMSPPDILPRISEPECRAFIAPLISGKKKKLRFETTIQCKDGRDLPVEAQLQLVQENSASSLFVAIVRNMTKRKFAETELRQQKNLLLQVIDMDSNMIFVRDAAGKFLLANQTISRFYGAPIRNLIGKKNSELSKNSQEICDFLASDRDVIENGRKVTATESVAILDGQQHWYLTVKQPLPQTDGSVNVLGIAVDISGQKQSEVKLAESYKELQRLALHLENVRAEERTQIARNLHDEMGANLAALNMRVAWLASKLPDDMPHLASEVAHISDLVTGSIKTVRQVVAELRPNLLDDVGLVAAVKDYVKRFEHDSGIACVLTLPDEDFSLNENQSITFFRIIQESLNNVAKHAQADKVDIRFELQDGMLRLHIKDNGVGFVPARKEKSFGLLGIQERALMIGGQATITSTPGKGTEVLLSIPISSAVVV